MKPLPKVLLVEDHDKFAGEVIGFLDSCGLYQVVRAATQGEVKALLDEHPNLIAAIVDGNVPLVSGGNPEKTLPLLPLLKERISGPIILFSMTPYNEAGKSAMLHEGFTHVVNKLTADCMETVEQILRTAL